MVRAALAASSAALSPPSVVWTGDEGASPLSPVVDSTATPPPPSLEDLSSLQNSSSSSSDFGDVAEKSRALGARSSSLCGCSGSVFGGVFLWVPFELSHSRRS